MRLHTRQTNNTLKMTFWMIGFISFGIRCFLTFSQEVLAGNGGYYPLQVRTVLERGELAFPDMPFLFFLEASIVKMMAFFGVLVNNEIILTVVKIIDSLSIPLALIPIFYIVNQVNTKLSKSIALTVLFSVLSFYTLNMLSTSQKNAMAITLLFATIAAFLNYLNTLKKGALAWGVFFFLMVGMTHFGTFVFALLWGVIYLVVRNRWKAIFPLVILLVASVLLIYSFDTVRMLRLISSFTRLFNELPNPPQIMSAIVYGVIAYLAYRIFRNNKHHLKDSERTFVATLIILLVIVSLPIIPGQYSARLNAFLFIPLVLLVLFFERFANPLAKRVISALFGLIILGSVAFKMLINPPEDLSKEALIDMAELKESISEPDKTVIVSRHNLEFWVAWILEVDVSQENKFDEVLVGEYETVFIINQIKGKRNAHSGGPRADNQRSHFDEPLIPENAVLEASSDYFRLYKYSGP